MAGWVDRTPQNVGRVRMTPVSGDLYDLEMADNPLEVGTPPTRIHMLTGNIFCPLQSIMMQR